jgi:anionic cell wall polymer biosynthesis LytR-Cps2A-Psr (LCP) family protein
MRINHYAIKFFFALTQAVIALSGITVTPQSLLQLEDLATTVS